MVTSDMQRAADLPSRCCLFNNCVQFTTFYMQRFTTVLWKMQISIFLLLVIVMDSIKSNVSVYFVEGIQYFSAISRHHDSQIIIPNYRFSVPR